MDDNNRPLPATPVIAPEFVEKVVAGKLEVNKRGALRILRLCSPAGDGKLNSALQKALMEAVPVIARDANIYCIVLRGGQAPVFSAGFDESRFGTEDLRSRCELIWMLECFSKPVVSLIDGSLDGGGAGITLVNTHRVAGEDYALSVSAVRRGGCPDGGTAYALSRLPAGIGAYLALTGRRIGRADALSLGLVTHSIDACHFGEIESELADATTVDPLLDGLHRDPGEAELSGLRDLIETIFADGSVNDIRARLRAQLAKANDARVLDWSAATLSDIEQAPALALEVTLRFLRAARSLDLRQTLALEYRLSRHLFAAAAREGTVLPSPARIDEMFRPVTLTDLHLPTRQEMQAARI